MNKVYIAGVGMTAFGKFADSSVRLLAQQAVNDALTDASVSADEVGMIFFANAVQGLLTGQEMIRGQVALRDTGLLGAPLVNVENACASASTAAHLAWMAVASGQVDVALAVGAEKLSHPDKSRTFSAVATGVDLGGLESTKAALYSRMGVTGGGADRSFFMDVYADMARAYTERSGATAKDFARVAVKSHYHGSLNPRAQYRNEVSVDEVLASRVISGDLTLLMCSPIGDGAAAVVFASKNAIRRTAAPRVLVRASSLVSGRFDHDKPSAEYRASQKAYEIAGIGPDDVDVVELHDAAAPAELIMMEELGLCPPGDAPKLLATGTTTLGGRLPINTSGGLISKGHPVGATGCAQLVELTEQLRTTAGARQVLGARVALAENGGGFLGDGAAAATVTILSRE